MNAILYVRFNFINTCLEYYNFSNILDVFPISVCSSPTLPAAVGVDLVRRFTRLAQTEPPCQDLHNHKPHLCHAFHGRHLPDLPAQQDRSAAAHAVYEVHVPQRVIWGVSDPALIGIDQREHRQWRPQVAPTTARTSPDSTRVAYCILCIRLVH